jgi:NADH:ubiquinone oxidoreductase subunit 6 (subunit J)
MEKKVTSTVVKGLVISLFLIVLSVAAQLLNFDTESWYKWLSTLLLLGAIIYSCILYANQNNHNVTFGNVFADGFKTTAVITCITILFTVLLFLIMPEMKQRFFDIAAKEAEKAGATDDMVEKQQAIFKNMFWVFIIGGIMVTYLIVGAIASLIGAAAAKKNPPNPFQQHV